MKNGRIVRCFEISLSWEPLKNVKVFAFTPGYMHIYEFATRKEEGESAGRFCGFEVMKLDESLIYPGMVCECLGVSVRLESDCAISVNGKLVKVKPDPDFVYNLQKPK